MISATGVSSPVWKRQSRRVRIPTTVSPSTIGRPEMFWRAMISRASPMVAVGGSVTGSRITPFAERLTLSTSRICPSIERLRWMIPMPPWRASPTASRHSVTVSIAAADRGMWMETLREKRVSSRTSRGMTSERRGMSRTSSKVSPSGRPSGDPSGGPGECCVGMRGSSRPASGRTGAGRLWLPHPSAHLPAMVRADRQGLVERGDSSLPGHPATRDRDGPAPGPGSHAARPESLAGWPRPRRPCPGLLRAAPRGSSRAPERERARQRTEVRGRAPRRRR